MRVTLHARSEAELEAVLEEHVQQVERLKTEREALLEEYRTISEEADALRVGRSNGG